MRHPRTLSGSLLAAALLAACSDGRSPVGALPAPGPGAALAELRCEAVIAARTVRCGTPASVGSQPAGGSARSVLTYGGQGLHVRLRSSGIAVDTAGAQLLFGFDVTLENLLRQPIATADTGSFAPDTGAVKVFLAGGPAATSGSGAVSVDNSDGTGTFTASDQEFFRFGAVRRGGVDGPMPVLRNDTTAPRRWVFRADSTVAAFAFTVFVTTQVPFGGGWTDLAEDSLWRVGREDTVALEPGDSVRLTARARDVFGSLVSAPVAHASSHPAVATVSATGMVTALAPGETVVSGGAPGRPSYRRTRVVVGPPSAEVALQEVAQGLITPLYVTAPPGDPRVFVVEKPGRIRVVENGVLLPVPFLDLIDRVSNNGERGLLSVAFHPSFATNRYLFVVYADLGGDIHVERYTANAPATSADPASAHPLLVVEHSENHNHNGGLAVFGPGGRLFVSLGDGGGALSRNGQDTTVLLGKMLRLDVDGGDPYAIPSDNPFIGVPGARPEIWAYGLRNPWRYSFDAGTLWLSDVGGAQWEEVNAVPAGRGGVNFGWNPMEGAHCRVPGCDPAGKELPVLEYDHSQGCAITGGYVYRGPAMPSLHGRYFYADYCEGWVRSFRLEAGQVVGARSHPVGAVGRITSFGTDAAGELYLTVAEGRVYRFVPGT